MPRLLYPLLPYRSMAFPFLLVCAVAVPCWLLLRLYLRRTPEHRPSVSRELLLLTVVVYLSGLASATLTPNHSTHLRDEATGGLDLHPSAASLTCSAAFLPSGSTGRGFCVRNAGGNALLFVPLGILLPLVWRRLRLRDALLIAIAISVSIELAQYVSRPWVHRTADVNDVILNAFGACVGLLLAALLRWRGGDLLYGAGRSGHLQ